MSSIDVAHRLNWLTAVQVRKRIRGIDKRTDVVTVTGNVKLRPDLFVEAIDAKDKSVVGTYVNIAGLVSELNTDVGATADCVLSVDGAQADTAVGIYVDAGSKVSCAFTHKFTTTGTHTLEVAVTNVTPGDWDTSNNSAEKSIEIVQAPVYYSAQVSSYQYDYSSQSDGYYRQSFVVGPPPDAGIDGGMLPPPGTYSSGQDWSYTTSQHQRYENANLSAYTQAGVSFPLGNVALSQTSDGVIVDSHAFSNVAADWSWGDSNYGYGSVYRFDPATYTYFYLTTYNWYGYAYTSATYSRNAGEVAYFSSNYSSYWYDHPWGSGGSTWTWNYDYSYANGQPWPVGSQYTIGLSVTDANGMTTRAAPTMTTQTSAPWGYTWPYTCSESTWPWGSQKYCSGGSQSGFSTYGYAYGMTE